MRLKRILSLILTLSIITTSFSSVVQISAQTDEELPSKVAAAKDRNVQTTAIPSEPTEEFIIKSKYDFSKFATRSKYWESNVKVTLACNIDMKGTTIKPIKEFSGVFDGCGYTISNLKIEDNSIGGKNSEFSFIKTLSQFAEIKNVTFNNCVIEGKPNISKAASLIITNHGTVSGVDIINGSINDVDKKIKAAGFVLNNEEDGVIENCHIENMSAKDSNIRSGFIGTNRGKITKCSTTLTVNSKDVAGGFVSENHGTIEECSFKGEVSSKKCAGGFCANNSGEITSCKSEGNVIAKTKSTKVATICGGFVGENGGIIKGCSSTGKVEGQEYVGGFVGINNDKGEISSCKATCDVKSHTNIASIYCGGFVGLDAGKIEGCTFDGKVDGCVDSEKVLGGVIGGLIAVIIIFAIIYLLVTYIKKHNAEIVLNKATEKRDKSKIEYDNNYDVDKFCDAEEKIDSINDSLSGINDQKKQLIENIENLSSLEVEKLRNLESNGNKLQNDKLKNEKYINQCNNLEETYLNDEDNQISASLTFLKAKKFFKNAINRSFVAVPISIFILAVSSGVPIRLTAGRKCAYVAGFCGLNVGAIIKCSASGSSVKAKSLHNKYNRFGGFVGTNSGTIKDSSATGKEICNETYTGGSLGGFVGENIGKIENGTTTISVANGKCTGGFCGNNLGEISGSKSEGGAKANATTVKTKCGGFVGNNDEKGKIDGCLSIGSAAGQEYVGGFAGVNKSEISGCNATGKATAKTKTNTACAGGFVGENEKGTIIGCTATGGADSQSSSGQAKTGGFVGINRANITNSKASGKVYLSAGILHKDDGCGGFVSKNDKGGIIDGCYAECIVETTNKKKGGGFVGEAKSKSTIKNSKCKSKIVTKAGIKDNRKFCQDKDKKALIENCYAN